MKRVFKYPIGIRTTLELPIGAKFLDVQLQNDDAHMWFEVDPDAKTEPRKFFIVGTGHEFNGGKYLGTFQNGPFVWHVYEDLGEL